MGFLDNSGDIILDAVLTDVGRKKMANGTFSITKFALGDDEIDYSLYNKDHASGTAYYDLEIMQTPVMEAFTQTNAGINYGLLTVTATDLLYLPALEINKKAAINNTVVTNSEFPNIFFVADTTADTSTNLLASDALADGKYFAVSNQGSGPAILLESGLNTTTIKGTAANRTTYLESNNLLDNYFYVYYDNRFINSVLGPASTATFNNSDSGDGTVTLNYSLTNASSVSTDLQLNNYSAARIVGPNNGIVYNSVYNPTDTSVSSISGPRSNFTLINVEVKPTLDAEYTKYGFTNNNLFSNGALYNYLDTTLYVQGSTTGIQVQVPLRIIKYISG
jgi:hypothetical protein